MITPYSENIKMGCSIRIRAKSWRKVDGLRGIESEDHARIERNQTDFDFEEEKLAKAFSELPLMRREVLRLLFVEEKTPEEIAQLLQCSVELVYKQKSRALIKLRAALTEGADE